MRGALRREMQVTDNNQATHQNTRNSCGLKQCIFTQHLRFGSQHAFHKVRNTRFTSLAASASPQTLQFPL